MQNINDVNLLNNFENDEIQPEIPVTNTKLFKYKGKQLFLVVQIVISLLVITSICALKFLNTEYFNQVRVWYNEKINDSLVAGNDIENYKDVLYDFRSSSKNSTNTAKKYKKNLVSDNVNISVQLSKPLETGTITSRFGKRNDPITKEKKSHHGLDIGAPHGQPIFSVLPGTVVKAEKVGSYGNCVVVDHGNNIQTLYAHCDKITVTPGTAVNRGQKLAMVGSSGRSTGDHLHFELVIDGTPYDPETFFEGTYI